MNIKLVAIPAIALAASLGLADTLGHHSTFTQAMRRLGNPLWESNYMGEAKAWKLAHGPMSTKQAMLESLREGEERP